jgi:hypothetical protein
MRWFPLCIALLDSTGMAARAANAGGVALLRVPDGGLQPKAAMGSDGTAHLVYLKGEPKACDVIYRRRELNQTNFASPLRVNSEPGAAIAIGTVRGADIALGKGGRVHVAWNGSQEGAAKEGGETPMLYARLNENGDRYEPQRNLMISTTHLDGGGSVAADAGGNVYVIWHGHSRTGPQDEQHRAVFVARSTDEGKTFAPEQRISAEGTGACGCCGLKALADNNGRVAILFRAANTSGNRDVTLLLSRDYGKTFQTKALGPWKVSMCPMSTMALNEAPDTGLFAAWETQGQIWYSSGDIAGASRAAPGKAGQRKHPVLVSANNQPGMLLAWTEGTGWAKGGSVAWQVIGSDGSAGAAGRAEGVPVWGSIAAISERDGTFTVIY